ncbi:uncharacterized protein SCDLUD_003532 [Saccharomycodes ludwigii]|uniref:uncharacterized protein n=1 Tax=Saccharomycodes ludwigii TaxID=36035 RepID=UPI001E82ED32|nr:hypothetical protein SCDLUD_003532 [Saccharomycodes ludwigii]KAH3900544.1 hypothetical protein SCDLUD_003532 [Saccharomycodes ludwigii]
MPSAKKKRKCHTDNNVNSNINALSLKETICQIKSSLFIYNSKKNTNDSNIVLPKSRNLLNSLFSKLALHLVSSYKTKKSIQDGNIMLPEVEYLNIINEIIKDHILNEKMKIMEGERIKLDTIISHWTSFTELGIFNGSVKLNEIYLQQVFEELYKYFLFEEICKKFIIFDKNPFPEFTIECVKVFRSNDFESQLQNIFIEIIKTNCQYLLKKNNFNYSYVYNSHFQMDIFDEFQRASLYFDNDISLPTFVELYLKSILPPTINLYDFLLNCMGCYLTGKCFIIIDSGFTSTLTYNDQNKTKCNDILFFLLDTLNIDAKVFYSEICHDTLCYSIKDWVCQYIFVTFFQNLVRHENKKLKTAALCASKKNYEAKYSVSKVAKLLCENKTTSGSAYFDWIVQLLGEREILEIIQESLKYPKTQKYIIKHGNICDTLLLYIKFFRNGLIERKSSFITSPQLFYNDSNFAACKVLTTLSLKDSIVFTTPNEINTVIIMEEFPRFLHINKCSQRKVNCPEDLQSILDSLKQQVLSKVKKEGRLVEFIHELGSGIIETPIHLPNKGGVLKLHVNFVQYSILNLFNEKDIWSVEEVIEKVNIDNQTSLTKALYSLMKLSLVKCTQNKDAQIFELTMDQVDLHKVAMLVDKDNVLRVPYNIQL